MCFYNIVKIFKAEMSKDMKFNLTVLPESRTDEQIKSVILNLI